MTALSLGFPRQCCPKGGGEPAGHLPQRGLYLEGDPQRVRGRAFLCGHGLPGRKSLPTHSSGPGSLHSASQVSLSDVCGESQLALITHPQRPNRAEHRPAPRNPMWRGLSLLACGLGFSPCHGGGGVARRIPPASRCNRSRPCRKPASGSVGLLCQVCRRGFPVSNCADVRCRSHLHRLPGVTERHLAWGRQGPVCKSSLWPVSLPGEVACVPASALGASV